MTVSTTNTYSGPYFPNGVTVAFPFTFKALSTAEVVVVTVTDSVETIVDEADYTVTLSDPGGTVTFSSAPASTIDEIYVLSEPLFTQTSNFTNQGAFLPSVFNALHDRAAIRDQYLKEKIDRAILIPRGGGVENLYPYIKPNGTVGFSSGTGADAGLRGDLADEDGAEMVGWKQAGADAVTRTAEDKARESVSVLDFGAVGDGVNDDTAAFDAAIATGKAVYVPSRDKDGNELEYSAGDITLTEGTLIYGDGMGRTIIRPNKQQAGTWNHMGTPNHKAIFYNDSGAAGATIKNITIRDLTVYGWAEDDAFWEFNHLIHLNGVEKLLVQRVEFLGFQGDGLQIGSSRTGGERHNKKITVRDCEFDGITRQNRNAISVIDGDDILIDNCGFKRCTVPTMPGPIDFEPDDYAYPIINNIKVTNCRFEDNGGNLGQISIQIPSSVAWVPRGIVFENNYFTGKVGTGSDISINLNRVLSATDPDMGVSIRGNRGLSGTMPYEFRSLKGAVCEGNTWSTYTNGALIGYNGVNDYIRNLVLRDTFRNVGTVFTVGASVFSCSNVEIGGSFIDCGSGAAGSIGVGFNNGTSEYVTLRCRIIAPTGKTTVAVQKEVTHTFSRATNLDLSQIVGSLPNNFESRNKTITAPTYSNGWVAFGDTNFQDAGYTKDEAGRVDLHGRMKSGTVIAGTVMATLPAGYRPAKGRTFNVVTNDTNGLIRITAAGDILSLSVNATYVALDGINFLAAA